MIESADDVSLVKSRRLEYNLMIQNRINSFSDYLLDGMTQIASSGALLVTKIN